MNHNESEGRASRLQPFGFEFLEEFELSGPSGTNDPACCTTITSSMKPGTACGQPVEIDDQQGGVYCSGSDIC